MSQETQTVTIALCAEGIKGHDQAIYTVVACFGGSEESLNQEKLAASFTPYMIEVKNGNLKTEVLDDLEILSKRQKQ